MDTNEKDIDVTAILSELYTLRYYLADKLYGAELMLLEYLESDACNKSDKNIRRLIAVSNKWRMALRNVDTTSKQIMNILSPDTPYTFKSRYNINQDKAKRWKYLTENFTDKKPLHGIAKTVIEQMKL